MGFASNIFVDDIIKVTNAYRQENGLPTLRFNPELSQAAQKKAEDMFADDYWAHVAPDGTKPWFFITAAGYDYVYAGENLAKDFQKSESVVVAWMESPTHRQNILNEKFKDIGVAVVNGTLDGYETTLVVQMFGQTLSAQAAALATPPATPSTTSPAEETVPEVLSEPAEPEPAVVEIPEEVEIFEESVSVESPIAQAPSQPRVDVFNLTRGMSLALGSMVLGFFTVDTYTARKRGLRRLSGHTVAHLGLLILLLGVTWFIKPGVVL